MKNKKILLTCGDSFTFGSEIIDPKFTETPPEPNKIQKMINPSMKDYDSENDEYRTARIWPTYLGELSGLEVINLAKPAISNKWIYNTTITWLLENYINKGKSTEDLILIIGWTSIVRKEFFFNVGNQIIEKTVNPNGGFSHETRELKEFFKWYVLTNQCDYEGAYDFININFDLTNFCKINGIEFYCFNALPEEHHTYKIERYHKDLNISTYIESFKNITTCWNRNLYDETKIKWGHVLPKSFYQKDKPLNSFLNFIKQLPINDRLYGVHPSPRGHKIWAEVLYEWIFNKDDLYMEKLTNGIPKSLI
jgi:hypothetical protein